MAEDKREIATDIYNCGTMLRGIAGMFCCMESGGGRELNEGQSNGVYLLLESIADDLEKAGGKVDRLNVTTG